MASAAGISLSGQWAFKSIFSAPVTFGWVIGCKHKPSTESRQDRNKIVSDFILRDVAAVFFGVQALLTRPGIRLSFFHQDNPKTLEKYR